MELPTIFIFTHDSIGLGEDGPTHQPVEQLASLRAIPNLLTIRPVRRQRSRRSVARHHAAAARAGRCWCCRARTCRRSTAAKYAPAAGLAKGAYVLADAPGGTPEVLLLGTGSEVALCVAAYEELKPSAASRRASSACRAGSCSSASRKRTATASCRPRSPRASPSSRRRPSAGRTTSAASGTIIGMRTFGASAPLKDLQRKFGFEPDKVVAAAKEQIASARVA